MALSREAGDVSIELSILISLQPEIDKQPVRAIGGCSDNRFICHGDEAGSFLARAFRKELFPP